jgi:hypothetical protein
MYMKKRLYMDMNSERAGAAFDQVLRQGLDAYLSSLRIPLSLIHQR